MLSPLRNRFGIPGVISVIALVFAMLGGAYAASNDGGSGNATASAKAKKGPPGPRGKTGKPGPAGPQGPAGPAGPAGAKGDTGAAGTNGQNGAPGEDGTDGVSVKSEEFAGTKDGKCNGFGGTKFTSASGATYACNGEEGVEGEPWTPDNALPSGATETGTWRFVSAGEEVLQYVPISFPIPLSAADAAAIEQFGRPKKAAPNDNCPGTVSEPKAAPGKLCIYASTFGTNFGGLPIRSVKPSASEEEEVGVATSGTLMVFEIEEEAAGKLAAGTFAVTAP